MLKLLIPLFGFNETSCPIQLTCFPTNPLDSWTLYQKIYGIPNAVILGLFLGIIVGGIYVRTRSLAHLAILGIYVIAVSSATWAAENSISSQYESALYIIVLAISALAISAVLKLLRE